MKNVTTIKLTKGTAELLQKLKVHPRQPYEEVVLRLLNKARLNRKIDKKGHLSSNFTLMLFLGIITIVILSLFIKNSSITGQVVKEMDVSGETTHYYQLGLEINNNSEYLWVLNESTDLRSIKLNGYIEQEAIVKVYITNDNKKYLIFDSNKLEKNNTINSSIEGLNQGTDDTNMQIENESIENSSLNNTITIKFEYAPNSSYDIDNNGQEYLTGVVDLTIKDTQFNWNVNEKNLCTKWNIYSVEDQESTNLCYGSVECCNFISLNPIRDLWNEIFYLTYGQYGSTLENIVSAQVLYVDYNLSIEGPYADIYYSKLANLSVSYYVPKLDFKDMCVETCNLENFSGKDYKLIFEVSNGLLKIDSISYMPPEKKSKIEVDLEIVNNNGEISGNFSLYKNNFNILLIDGFVEPDYYGVEAIPKENFIDKLIINNLNLNRPVNANIIVSNVTKEVYIENLNVTKIYAIDLNEIEFEDAYLIATATANSLYRCEQWNFENELCVGNWEKINDLINGQQYEIMLTSGISAFGEGNFNVIDLTQTNLTNITDFTFVNDIPNITISINNNATINLSAHILNMDDKTNFTYYKPNNISITFNGTNAIVVPDKDFIGLEYTYITANSNTNVAVSNVFSINIINSTITQAKKDLLINLTDQSIQLKLKKHADLNLKPALKYDTINFTGYEINNDVVIIHATFDGKSIRWLTSLSNFDEIVRTE